MRLSQNLIGCIDSAKIGAGGRIGINGWALDISQPELPVNVVAIYNAQLVCQDQTRGRRQDISKHFPHLNPANCNLNVATVPIEDFKPEYELVVQAFNSRGDFAVIGHLNLGAAKPRVREEPYPSIMAMDLARHV